MLNTSRMLNSSNDYDNGKRPRQQQRMFNEYTDDGDRGNGNKKRTTTKGDHPRSPPQRPKDP